MSDILKESTKWLQPEVSDSSTWKKKQRFQQFLALERHVLEWIDRANQNRVAINDYVLKVATEKLMAELGSDYKEDYTDFNVSNGWIHNLKQRHSLRSKKKMR